MGEKVNVVGVGMTKFHKPGQSPQYNEMGAEAARAALADAGLDYGQIQQAFVGYAFGDSASGQRTLYEVGITGIPIINVNNLCATGSTALFLARQAIGSGVVDCALALGFEQMNPGALTLGYEDRTSVASMQLEVMEKLNEIADAPMSPQAFALAGREYMEQYGTSAETLARISVKARRHAAKNPNAVFREPLTIEDVLASREIFSPLTKFQCSPPTCGAAAAILCSDDFATKHGVQRNVSIAGQSMTSDFPSAFEADSMMKLMGYDMAVEAAKEVYESTGIGPGDVDVIELHDCYTTNELITYECLGLTREGTAEQFVLDGDNTYGGKYVVNPSGGLLSKGHPIGATGLAQCAELVWQLRGQADGRQVEGARVALQHNIGPGGACVVTMYRAA